MILELYHILKWHALHRILYSGGKRLKNKNNKSGDKKWGISFLPILKYNIVLCIMTVLIIIFGGAIFTVQNMKNSTHEILVETDRDIEYRIDQSIRFLKSLASQKRYYDPEVPVEEKITELDMINTYYGYLMIRYVDSNVNVYSQRGPSSLASRDYMQRLFLQEKFRLLIVLQLELMGKR